MEGIKRSDPQYGKLYTREYRQTSSGREVMRKSNQVWREGNREKIRATDRVRYACKIGKIIKPDVCSKCGCIATGRGLHGHHDDYSKPLVVRWLCHACHEETHEKYKESLQPVSVGQN